MLTNSKDIIRRLEKDGWVLRRINGSHHIYMHPTKPGRPNVPFPKKDLPLKTVLDIYKNAGWEKD